MAKKAAETPEEIAVSDGTPGRQVPADLADYKGKYKYLKQGTLHGHIFGLKILDVEDVRSGKTHHAKSPLAFWDGTEDEFRANFEKL